MRERRESGENETEFVARRQIWEIIEGCNSERIVLTHGTDTIIQTAAFLSAQASRSREKSDKTIVLTGSFLPETFKQSDADFNLGLAVGRLNPRVQQTRTNHS